MQQVFCFASETNLLQHYLPANCVTLCFPLLTQAVTNFQWLTCSSVNLHWQRAWQKLSYSLETLICFESSNRDCTKCHLSRLFEEHVVEIMVLFSSVRPPKKSWKNISNLSGGEKTLSSLALVWAHIWFSQLVYFVMILTIEAAVELPYLALFDGPCAKLLHFQLENSRVGIQIEIFKQPPITDYCNHICC